MTVHQYPSQGKCIIHVHNDSPVTTSGKTLGIYDLSGRLVDELELILGKAVWNTASVPGGTYVMRLAGTGNYRCQKILLLR
jgi:hypothetical protein